MLGTSQMKVRDNGAFELNLMPLRGGYVENNSTRFEGTYWKTSSGIS